MRFNRFSLKKNKIFNYIFSNYLRADSCAAFLIAIMIIITMYPLGIYSASLLLQVRILSILLITFHLVKN